MSSSRPLGVMIVLGLLALVGARGCASASRPIFTPVEPALRWPPPPERARIEFVGALRGERDLNRPASLGETLFGAEEDRTLRSPYGVCTDGGNRIFVVDAGDRAVQVFDLDTRRFERWTPGSAVEGGFRQPLGAAWDAAGRRLLVADAEAGHVVALDGSGRADTILGAADLVRPSGVAVDPGSGRIFVADAGAHQVLAFDRDGQVVARIGARGVEPGRFNYPTNVAVGRDGAVYVADTLNFRVQVFDRGLRPVRVIGAQGNAPGYFSQPKGLALDRDGHLYVVDAHFESVQIFDEAGRLLLAFGREGRAPGEFWLPAAIHIDASDRIWIADTYNQRVQVFRYLAEAETSNGRPEEE